MVFRATCCLFGKIWFCQTAAQWSLIQVGLEIGGSCNCGSLLRPIASKYNIPIHAFPAIVSLFSIPYHHKSLPASIDYTQVRLEISQRCNPRSWYFKFFGKIHPIFLWDHDLIKKEEMKIKVQKSPVSTANDMVIYHGVAEIELFVFFFAKHSFFPSAVQAVGINIQ